MEGWTPLFDIFLNSTCPETEASLWLTKSFNPSSNTTPISTSSFLSLLTKLSDANLADPCSSPQDKRVMLIQTLPDLVQARILSYLAFDHQRFCKKDLCKLARTMLGEGRVLDFWVKKAAQQLLDLVSLSNYQWISHLNLDSEEETVDGEFHSLPDWLRIAAKDSKPLFPWLPMSPDELNQKMLFNVGGGNEQSSSLVVEDKEQEDFDEVMEEVDVDELKLDHPIETDTETNAERLKIGVLNLDSASKAVELANDIRELCLTSRQNSLAILHLIQPWKVDDEFAAVLISHLSEVNNGDELVWPGHVLCSVILPKLLTLIESPSRLLISATVEFCKSHQRTVEYSLLFPLILRNEGINNPICDVITRIVKDCLHPVHVSSFCHKLLGKDKDSQKFICLPCHRYLISDEIVWTESLFSLFQNILNHNVHFAQDSVDRLVTLICRFADRSLERLLGSLMLELGRCQTKKVLKCETKSMKCSNCDSLKLENYHKEAPFSTSLMQECHCFISLITFKLTEVNHRNLHLLSPFLQLKLYSLKAGFN